MIDRCCGNGLYSLLLQINVICVLLAAIGITAIMKYPAWFGDGPVVAQLVGR